MHPPLRCCSGDIVPTYLGFLRAYLISTKSWKLWQPENGREHLYFRWILTTASRATETSAAFDAAGRNFTVTAVPGLLKSLTMVRGNGSQWRRGSDIRTPIISNSLGWDWRIDVKTSVIRYIGRTPVCAQSQLAVMDPSLLPCPVDLQSRWMPWTRPRTVLSCFTSVNTIPITWFDR